MTPSEEAKEILKETMKGLGSIVFPDLAPTSNNSEQPAEFITLHYCPHERCKKYHKCA